MTTQARRSFAELFGIVLVFLGVWSAVAVFMASDFYHFVPVYSAANGVGDVHQEFLWAFEFQMTTAFVWAFFTAPIVYFAERFPIAPPHATRNLLIVAASLPFIATLRAVIGGAALQYGEGLMPTWKMATESLRIRFHRWTFITVIIILVVNLILAYQEARARERRSFTREAELARTELAKLRARLQPRFMFATLRAIGERIRTRPNEADELLVSLSALLRRSLDFDRRVELTLRDELDFVDQYLQIESIRVDRRLTYRIDVDDVLLRAKIPPMLLHALVENAIVSGADRGGALVLRGFHDGVRLRLQVRTSFAAAGDDALLRDTRDRLCQLFGDRQSLEARREEGEFVTEISVPLHLSIEVAA